MVYLNAHHGSWTTSLKLVFLFVFHFFVVRWFRSRRRERTVVTRNETGDTKGIMVERSDSAIVFVWCGRSMRKSREYAYFSWCVNVCFCHCIKGSHCEFVRLEVESACLMPCTCSHTVIIAGYSRAIETICRTHFSVCVLGSIPVVCDLSPVFKAPRLSSSSVVMGMPCCVQEPLGERPENRNPPLPLKQEI